MVMVFEAEHLTKRYGRHTVLDSLYLAVPQGNIYGLVGENGAGKTTLIRLMVGLDFPTAGEFSLFGEMKCLARQRRMGFLYRRSGSLLEYDRLPKPGTGSYSKGCPRKGLCGRIAGEAFPGRSRFQTGA